MLLPLSGREPKQHLEALLMSRPMNQSNFLHPIRKYQGQGEPLDCFLRFNGICPQRVCHLPCLRHPYVFLVPRSLAPNDSERSSFESAKEDSIESCSFFPLPWIASVLRIGMAPILFAFPPCTLKELL